MNALLPLLAAVAAGAQTLEGVDASALARQAASARPAQVVVDTAATGAWYRKIESVPSVDWDGISAAGVLPAPQFDPNRMHAAAPSEEPYKSGPLDSPSVYVGLHAAAVELDAGLKWDHTYGADGSPLGIFAWRVFWRVHDASGDKWRNPVPGSAADIYLLPGDAFTMTLKTAADGSTRLEIRGGGQSFSTSIPLKTLAADGKPLPRAYKRVHAIDQFRLEAGLRVGNELGSAIPTSARLTGGRWSSTDLLCGARRMPLTGGLARDVRGADEADVDRAVFPTAGLDARGGEPIDVLPPAPSAP